MGGRGLASSWTIAAVLAAAVGAAPVRGEERRRERDVRLSGCLVRGERGDYLLTNPPGDPTWQRTADAIVLPGPEGTTGTFATIFFWLKHRGLDAHVGHVVELEGQIVGDFGNGLMTIERKAGWHELRVTSAGAELRARIQPGPIAMLRLPRREASILVRTVTVVRVRTIAGGCPR